MRTATASAVAVGVLGLLLWCCTTGEAPAVPTSPAPDAMPVATDAATTRPGPDAAEAGPPFVLPPAAPYDSPTCHHPTVVSRCENGWCLLPKGCFLFGTPETEKSRSRYGEEQRETTFTHDLLISQFETTQQQWKAAGLPNRSADNQRPDLVSDCLEERCPVGKVTWFDTWVYANILNDREGLEHCAEPRECTGTPGGGLQCKRIEQLVPSLYECRGYRLPTRTEYEYAARGGTRTEFYSGAMTGTGDGPELHLREVAWFTENSGHRTHPVGQKIPNRWGVYDILGNSGERITEEGIGLSTPAGPLVDFRGVLNPTDDSDLIRGGFASAQPWGVRAGARSLATIRNASSPGVGFRLVRSLPSAADAGPTDATTD